MAKITAYRTDTGAEVRIPEHWIGHPTLGEPFTTTPPKTPPASWPTTAKPAGDAETTSEVATPAARKEK